MIDALDTQQLTNINGGKPSLDQAQSDELRQSFLTLLTTQLENQDPLKPLENAEMTSQIAQINTVSGVEKLNDTLSSITRQMDADRMLQASGLIGNAVLVPGNSVKVSVDEQDAYATPFGVELEAPAQRAEIKVRNQGGEVVYEETAEGLDAGVQSFDWDALNSQGEPLPAGNYQVSVEAFDSEGESLATTPLNYALVQGVSPADSAPGKVRLDLGAVYGQVGIDDVKQIL